MSKPKLALIPSGYKSGKVYSILPNDASGDFEFTRQSIGTRVRKDGLIEEAKTSGSITNELLYSEDFTQSNWFNTNSTDSISTVVSPDGASLSTLLTSTASNGGLADFNEWSTAVKTASIYVKKNTSSTFRIANLSSPSNDIVFNLDSGTVQSIGGNFSGQIISLPNGWFRCVGTHQGTSSQTLGFTIPTSGQSVYIWGAMLSEGALSDYIKTEGSSETKTVETFTDVPRLDWYNSNCPSLLLEPQRTNYATNNTSMDTYSNSVFGNNPNPTQTADYTIAPDGTLTATRLQTSKTGTNYSLISFPTTSDDGSGSGYYTASVYVKSNTGSSQSIAFYGANSAPNQRTATTEWSRIQFTGQRLGNTKYAYLGTINGTDDDIDISVWGAQIELVNSYPSSLIYTGASAVTRLKDECYINSGIDNIINTDEGTLYFEVETPRVSTSSDFDRVVLSDQTATTDRVIFDNFNGSWRVVLTSNAGTQTASIRSVQANTKIKVAFTYSASEIKVSYDGNDVTTTSITYTPASTLESFKFSNAAGNGQFFQGKIHDVRYFDTILSNAELKELTL